MLVIDRNKEILRDMAIALKKLQDRVKKLEESLEAPVQTSVNENRGAVGHGPWPWPDPNK